MATSLSTPTKLSVTFTSPALHTLCKRLPVHLSPQSSNSSSFFLSLSKSLGLFSYRPLPFRRRFTALADSGNGVEPCHYNFNLFTIGVCSGGVRASRFAANFGASVAVCELLFATISSETARRCWWNASY